MQSFGDHYLYDGLGTVIALGPQPHPLVSCDSSDGALAYAEENERDHAALVAVKKGRIQAVVDEPQQAGIPTPAEI
jgi:hypothetical protein